MRVLQQRRAAARYFAVRPFGSAIDRAPAPANDNIRAADVFRDAERAQVRAAVLLTLCAALSCIALSLLMF